MICAKDYCSRRLTNEFITEERAEKKTAFFLTHTLAIEVKTCRTIRIEENLWVLDSNEHLKFKLRRLFPIEFRHSAIFFLLLFTSKPFFIGQIRCAAVSVYQESCILETHCIETVIQIKFFCERFFILWALIEQNF